MHHLEEKSKNEQQKKAYDLSEEASRRPGDEKATEIARRVESDDINEETNIGAVNTNKDDVVDNKVWTSASDE